MTQLRDLDPANYREIISRANNAASDASDRVYCKARVLERLDDVEQQLAEIERKTATQCERRLAGLELNPFTPFTPLRRAALSALYYGLTLASDVHALTVVDNKSGIAQQLALAENREKARSKTSRTVEHQKWNDAATWRTGM